MKLQAKLVGAFVAVALPGIAASVAAVGLFDQVMTDEIGSRTREVVAETRLILEDELRDITERLEAIGVPGDTTLAALAHPEPTAPHRGEDWAPTHASTRRLDILAVVRAENGAAELVSSAHLPASVGDPSRPLEPPFSSGETRSGLVLEMVEGNPPKQVPALVAVHAPPAFGGRLLVYGGRRLDRRLLGRLAHMAHAQLTLVMGGKVVARFPEARRPAVGGEPDALLMPRLEGGVPGRLEVSVDNARMWSARGRFLWLAQIAGAAALLMGLAGGLVLAGRMSRPVRALSRAAERVGAGDLDVHVPPTTRDEVGTLVHVFNRMTGDLREARSRIQQAERVAAWREVARQLAHEIRNPLSPMRLGMENLRKAWAKQHPRLEAILEESTRSVLEEVSALDRLVTSFSTFAQLPAPDPEPTAPIQLLEAAARLYDARVQIAEGLEVLPEVMADRDLVGRALVNVIKNALEAGATEVRLGATKTSEAGRAGVRFDVEDDGPGMTSEVLERASALHFTTKAHGSGMGLAVVRRTLEDHGGLLQIVSHPGAGTCIQMWLPTAEVALSDVRH